MYAVVVFALALLSPLPFVSPFDSIVQDATAQSSAKSHMMFVLLHVLDVICRIKSVFSDPSIVNPVCIIRYRWCIQIGCTLFSKMVGMISDVYNCKKSESVLDIPI